VLGITPQIPNSVRGPVAAFGLTKDQTIAMFEGTFASIKLFPEKVPKLWSALTGAERDPETPISVVGASRIGGELFGKGEFPTFLLILAGLNFFVGIFNLLPLLPLDGGHIAIAWFEKVRSWIYARLRRPDPGRVDYMKLMPVTYAVILLFGGFTLLTIAADIVNPITLFK
jgi:membrane-associated protease RseP (regulator of RpoE activity)